MIRAVNQRRALPKAVPSTFLVLVMALSCAATPAAQARGTAAAPVTTTAVTYLLDTQLVHGPTGATGVHGWLSGTLNSTGLLTATLTSGELSPLTAGCAPYVDFGPACGLPASANVTGNVTDGVAALIAKGKGWTWVLAGATSSLAGSWAGTLTQGNSGVGSWALTPATTTIHIDAAIKSDAKSTDKVVLVGSINLYVTLDGRAVGTFSPQDGSLPIVVQGWANNIDFPSVAVAIPRGKMGTMLLTAWSRTGFGTKHWNGSFVGPAKSDHGTLTGQG